MEPWRTGIVDSDDAHIRIRGHDMTSLMRAATFSDVVYLLHGGKVPSAGERSLMDAILIACADHGSGAPSCATARLAASGNRQSVSAAVAAGILAIGDEHGGAGSTCMEMIAAGVERSERDGIPIAEAASKAVSESRAAKKRLPGLGHRVHKVDPRTAVLFDMARQAGVAGNGVAFMEGLEKAAAAQIRPLPINVDGAIAAVLYDLGFPSQFGKLVFIIGRTAGIAAEVAEEYAREKPMRIRIPVTYDGDPPKSSE